jgi:hypothetical protein
MLETYISPRKIFLRKCQLQLMYWFPQYEYVALVLQTLWFLPSGILWLYLSWSEKDKKQVWEKTYSNRHGTVDSEKRNKALKLSGWAKKWGNVSMDKAVAAKKKLVSANYRSQYDRIYWVIWLPLVIFVGPVSAIVQTYAINCDGSSCVRAIAIDEVVPMQQGYPLTIDLKNPKTGIVDGTLNITLKELSARVVGTYEYSVVPFTSETWHYYSDREDCDGSCGTPWDAVASKDFGWRLSWEVIRPQLYSGMWSWTTKLEDSESNEGFCAAMSWIKPDFSKYKGRAFSLGNVFLDAVISYDMVTAEERVSKEWKTQFVSETLEIADQSTIQFGVMERPLKEIENSRIICWFQDGGIETRLEDCSANAVGINSDNRLVKTFGEGERGYNVWRASGITSSWGGGESVCDGGCVGSITGCHCNCQHMWRTDMLPTFNRQDILDLGTSIVNTNCYSSIVVQNISQSKDPWGRCVDPHRTTKEDCLAQPGLDQSPSSWMTGYTSAPMSMNLISSGCTGSTFTVKASILSAYDSEININYLSEMDVKFGLAGCWGAQSMMELTITTETAGTLVLRGDTLIVPSVLYLDPGIKKVNCTASFAYEEYVFAVVNVQAQSESQIKLSYSPDICDGVQDGGNGDSGVDDGPGVGADSAWIIWLVVAIIVFVVIIVLVIICIYAKRRKDKMEMIIKNQKKD